MMVSQATDSLEEKGMFLIVVMCSVIILNTIVEVHNNININLE